MIIDFHTHVDHAEAYGWFDPPEKLLPLLDEAGIARAAIMTYVDLPGANPKALELIAEAVSRYPDRLIGFVRLDPSRGGPGAGLGLALVAAVARMHAAALELADNAPGLRAILRFPAPD